MWYGDGATEKLPDHNYAVCDLLASSAGTSDKAVTKTGNWIPEGRKGKNTIQSK